MNKNFRKLSNGKRVDVLDDYEKDIRKFAKYIKGKPPKSQVVMLVTLKKFFMFYSIDFPERLWVELSVGQRPITEKKTPNREQLRYILQNGSLKHKALFMMCASSGMRIREAISLTKDDIDIDNRIITIRDTKAKSKYTRYTFFTNESKELLLNWLKQREKYIESKSHKPWYVKSRLEKEPDFKDDRIFPFDYTTCRIMWNSLLEKAGAPFNQKDDDERFKSPRYVYNEHGLRRYFINAMRTTDFKVDYRNYVIGHQSELDKDYEADNIFIGEVKKQYDKYCNALSVFSELEKLDTVYQPRIERLDNDLVRYKKENEKLKNEIESLKKEKFDRDYDDERIGYILKDRDNKIKDLEIQVESLIEAFKGMVKHKAQNK